MDYMYITWMHGGCQLGEWYPAQLWPFSWLDLAVCLPTPVLAGCPLALAGYLSGSKFAWLGLAIT
jgi:hypothetical protein